MLLSCPNCATSYEVDRTSLGSAGRSVRCLRCRHVWFASNTAAFAELAQAHRADMAAFATDTSAAGIASPSAAPTVPYEADASADAAPVPDAGAVLRVDENLMASLDAENGAQDLAAQSVMTAAVPADERDLAAVAVGDAPALAPTDGAPTPLLGQRAYNGAASEDIETVAARRTARAAKQRRIRSVQSLTTAILVLIAIFTGLVAWRSDVVRWLPQTASLYAAIRMPVNLRGLDFANVRTESDSQDGVPVLVVAGEIVSKSRRTVEVPRLRFAVRDDSGREIYTWTALPSRSVLTPGASLAFRSRLASPPREGHQVLVRFFNRRDLVAGLP